VTRSQAQASLAPLFHRTVEMEVRQSEFAHVSPNTRQQFLRMTLNVMPGSGGNNLARIFLEAPVLAMGAMAWLVLIIACANVANLMIARSVAREKEIVIRMAIGASHARIVRRLMIESLILALAGGLIGLLVSPLTMRLLAQTIPEWTRH
jgi:ABC-type antimicrobial peptide transport system permease subunit